MTKRLITAAAFALAATGLPQSAAAQNAHDEVTFSKDMQTKEMWSFVYANPAAFPKIAGPIRYVDARTCVLPVALERGQTYGMWINSKSHDSFRDLQHRPAVPYLLVFKTRE